MSLVVLGSLKGAPGVSTLVATMAYKWPAHRRLAVIEADADGGVFAARFGLHPETPSLVSFAASSRHGIDPECFWESCQKLPEGPKVMVVPSGGRSTHRSLLQVDFSELEACLTGADLLVDAGRLRGEGPSQRLCEQAGLLIVVVRPIFEHLALLLHRAPEMIRHTNLGVVIVGEGPYPAEEIDEALSHSTGRRVSVLGTVAWDPRGAEGLKTETGRTRTLRRSTLARTVKPVTDLVVRLIPVSGKEIEMSAGGVVGAGRT